MSLPESALGTVSARECFLLFTFLDSAEVQVSNKMGYLRVFLIVPIGHKAG